MVRQLRPNNRAPRSGDHQAAVVMVVVVQDEENSVAQLDAPQAVCLPPFFFQSLEVLSFYSKEEMQRLEEEKTYLYNGISIQRITRRDD